MHNVKVAAKGHSLQSWIQYILDSIYPQKHLAIWIRQLSLVIFLALQSYHQHESYHQHGFKRHRSGA